MALLLYIIIGGFIVLWIVQSILNNTRSSKLQGASGRRGFIGASRYPRLEHQITKRCNWDESAKERLIRATHARYPDKDEKWVLEKVLFDLERDFR